MRGTLFKTVALQFSDDGLQIDALRAVLPGRDITLACCRGVRDRRNWGAGSAGITSFDASVERCELRAGATLGPWEAGTESTFFALLTHSQKTGRIPPRPHMA